MPNYVESNWLPFRQLVLVTNCIVSHQIRWESWTAGWVRKCETLDEQSTIKSAYKGVGGEGAVVG